MTNIDPKALEAVSAALRDSAVQYLDIKQICKAARLDNATVNICLNALSKTGQIDLIAGGSGRPNRYSWLATPPIITKPRPESAAPASTPTVGAAAKGATPKVKATAAHVAPQPSVQHDAALPQDRTSIADKSDNPGRQRFLVLATKRKPRMLAGKEAAEAAAEAAVRAGAQRAEVFELMPLGAARRGIQWSAA